ncbi:hypothetical protein RUM8411_04471 [Ruegeria meonggei]|uniref:Uncharacterized protein n=1 Tax=Ruegeria meonggei TaxID=1446476 RepID=A0A1X7ACY9_9RHOB|nr:hypothetical protein RUM8411_04471 [Ruegeria meonggei]
MVAGSLSHHFPFVGQRDLDKPNALGRQGEDAALPPRATLLDRAVSSAVTAGRTTPVE